MTMTHTWLQLTNKLFVSQIIIALGLMYLLVSRDQSYSAWYWAIGVAAVYLYSAILAGAVRLLTTGAQ